MLADDRRAWLLGADDRWRRVEDAEQPGAIDTFEALMAAARQQLLDVTATPVDA